MVAASLRIVFFGTPHFAVPTLAALMSSRHDVCGVVTQPDRARGRGHKIQPAPVKAYAVVHGLPILQPERLREPAVADTLRAWKPDLGVVAAYGKLIPPSLLALPSLGMVNVHASLLPKYRGAAPVHRAVIDGEVETGVTIMRVSESLDTGNMLAKATQPIGPDETSDVLEQELAGCGAQLLVQVVDAMASGRVPEEPQDERFATYAPRLTKEEGFIDWSRSAFEIHNQVRGLFPWPHAYTYVGGSRLIVLSTRIEPDRTDAPPGTILAVSGDALHVAAGDGARIVIHEIQPEGRRPMRVRDYLAGHPIAVGARFASR